MRKSGFIVFFAAFLAMPALAEIPQKLTLNYELSRNGTVLAETTVKLEQGSGKYKLLSTSRGVGIGALFARGEFKRSSSGNVTSAGLQPIEFSDQRGDKPAVNARFDWNAKTAAHTYDGKTEQAPLPAGTQDRLSFLYALAFIDHAKPLPKEIVFELSDGRHIDRETYEVRGRVKLDTKAGAFDTLHLVKRPEAGDKRGGEMWLAVSRNYMPVRILLIDDDGVRMDQVITTIQP